jgi:hypothetical protein
LGVAALAITGAAFVLSFRPIYEPDLWWHLAQGRENAAGRLIRSNLFSFNYPDYRQNYTSWGFDTAAFAAWTAAGPVAIQALQAGVLALTLAVVYAACRVRSGVAGAAAVLMLGFFILEPRAIPRPHLVSFAALAACALVLERAFARRSAAALWWSVPIVALWSNFHVECSFGVAMIALAAASIAVRPASWPANERRRAVVVAVVCAAATLANPYGWGLLKYFYENWSVPQILDIAELQPPPLSTYRAFYAYLALSVALLAWRARDATVREVVVFAAFAALGLRFIRLTPLVWLATAPTVSHQLDRLASRRAARLMLAGAAVSLGITVSRLPIQQLFTQLAVGHRAVAPESFFSPQAIAFARRAGLEGPVFNSHNLGGYLAWSMYPAVRVFQDARLQAYPPEHFLSILVAARSQDDWNVLVADVDWAVLSVPRPNQLSGAGRFPPSDWAVVFRDEAMQIVVRRRGKYGTLAAPGLEPAARE